MSASNSASSEGGAGYGAPPLPAEPADRTEDDGAPMSIRLLVVDDHASFRTAVTEMVDADRRFDLVATVDSGEAALELAASTSLDLVVMDVRMPGIDGLAAAATFRRVQPDAVVLLVSTSDLDPARAAAVGAAFIPKVALSAGALLDAWAGTGRSRSEGSGDGAPA
jgi:CheY-like chemotaxis protein